jgi:hypothetical protein
MFNRGHALPLVLTRFLRPRIGRGANAEYPRGSLFHGQNDGLSTTAVRSGTVHDLDLSVSAKSPRSRTVRQHRHGHNQDASANMSTSQTVREQTSAAVTNCPHTVRILELSTSSISPRLQTRYDPTLASERPGRRVLASAARALKFFMATCIIRAHVRF